MTETLKELVAEERLRELAEHELAIARAAAHLARNMPVGPEQIAVAELAECAEQGSKTLYGIMRNDEARPLIRHGVPLEFVVRATGRLNKNSALRFLEIMLQLQERRLLEALDVVDTQAQYAIVRWARPAHLRACTYLRRARSVGAAGALQTSS